MHEFSGDPAEEAFRIFEEGYQKQIKGKLDEAIELYRQSLELHASAECHTFLGWAFSMKGLYDEAIDECQRAIEIDPDYGNPYNDIGSYLIERGELDDAIPWLEKATKATRYDNYCYPNYNLGRVWEKKGDWIKALRYYQAALRENQKYTLASRSKNRILSLLN